MKEIEANKQAWAKIATAHYNHFKSLLADPEFKLNPIVTAEIGDVTGKKILHLQCNTGADSIHLARMGAHVTGVDLVPENIAYAQRLATEFGIENVTFVASDVLELMNHLDDQFDLVLTTDGVIGWLPDLNTWGRTISHFLKPDGEFYLHDAHPFILIFDEEALCKGSLLPKYPYFQKDYDPEFAIGGYASQPVEAENYYWTHELSTIITGLLAGNLYISYFNEYDRCVSGMGGTTMDQNGLYYYPDLETKLPLVMSLKAKKLP